MNHKMCKTYPINLQMQFEATWCSELSSVCKMFDIKTKTFPPNKTVLLDPWLGEGAQWHISGGHTTGIRN